jgi:hypothetical protein
MVLQPKSGHGLPFWGFVQGWIVSPAPNPQPGGPGLRIYDPRRQGGPAIPPGTGYTFQSPFTTCMRFSGTILYSRPPQWIKKTYGEVKLKIRALPLSDLYGDEWLASLSANSIIGEEGHGICPWGNRAASHYSVYLNIPSDVCIRL